MRTPPLTGARQAGAALAMLAASTLLGLFALPVQAASADAYHAVFNVYTLTGQVPACRFPSSELESAYREADPEDVQYFPDFRGAIQTTLAAQATGECSSRRSRDAAALAAGPAGRIRPGSPPGSPTAATDSGFPAPLLFLLILGAGGALLASGLGFARTRGWDPAWAASVRHSWGEAEYRVSGAWAEFRDWLRSA